MSFVFFFFFSSRRRHTISLCDWSSDVCSSDLGKLRAIVDLSRAPGPHAVRSEGAKVIIDLGDTSLAAAAPEIGRASCRERVKIWVGAVPIKEKKKGGTQQMTERTREERSNRGD